MSELLAPAGSKEALDAAIGEGADAVYVGLKSFNARLRSANFAWNQFEAAVQTVHKMGKKIYVTVNTVLEEAETEKLYRFLSYLNNVGPDALIVQDFGVVRMCQEFFPALSLHASTQMNIESAAAANEALRQGITRVVLARELGLQEIQHIKESTRAELEVFVHGALCVSESGLCLFSSFLGGKSANRGVCTQACRRVYNAELPAGEKPGYYFSPCDLQLLEEIPALMRLGVESFKIEGRMKSAEYVGSVTAAYRYVMDHWQEDKKGALAEGKRILSTDFARSKTNYWYGFSSYTDGIEGAGEKILNPEQAGGTGIYLGRIAEVRPASEQEKKLSRASVHSKAGVEETAPEENIQMALVKGGSYTPDPGDSIRLHRHDDTGRESHKVRIVQRDAKGNAWIDIPRGFKKPDEVYLLQTKAMSKRYKRVIPQDISAYKMRPGDERLPILDLTPVKNEALSWFPEGLYIAVSTIADAHLVQAVKPVRVILELNNESEYDLLEKDKPEKPILPFSKKQVIISLDPFLPEGAAPAFFAKLDALIQKGYATFIANNLAHIHFLRTKHVHIIAGPYLYTFNKWALSFLENEDVFAFQMPYENSQKNLEQTVAIAQERKRVLLPIFAYPPLFRMRFKLPQDYDFTFFTDKEGTSFKVNSTPDGSFVMPELPFSIIDKAESLKTKGFKRLLIDFSKTKVVRSTIKDLTTLLYTRTPVEDSVRFNWKDGFYNAEKMEAYRAIDAKRNEQKAATQRFAQKNKATQKNKGKKKKR